MLPNDPLLGLAQAKATMDQRIHQSAQLRLAASAASSSSPAQSGLGARRWPSAAIGLLLAAGIAVSVAPPSKATNGVTHMTGSIANRTLSGGVARHLSSQELVYVNRAKGLQLGQ